MSEVYLPALFEYRDHLSHDWHNVLELPRNFHFMSMVAAKDVGFGHSPSCSRCRDFGQFVARRYQVLALRLHPGRGGTQIGMQELNEAVRQVRRYLELPFFPEIDWTKECA